MTQHSSGPTGRPVSESVIYPVYYVPVEWVAAPSPALYTHSPPNPSPIAPEYPVLSTSYRPTPPDFNQEPCQRTEYGVLQQVRRPFSDPPPFVPASHLAEASSSVRTLKSPYLLYGRHQGPENSRTTVPFANYPRSLGVTTSADDHQCRKSTSPPPNSSVPRCSRRQLTHLESEKKRREAINAGIEALRRAIPGCEGDSKAVILEKAVQYISHLESLVRDTRVRGATDCTRQSLEEESQIKSEPE